MVVQTNIEFSTERHAEVVDNVRVNALFTSESTLQASNILSAWEQRNPERLESGLERVSHLCGHFDENAAEHERLELLAGIAEQMARMMNDSAGSSRDEAELYCGLLRHLSAETPRPN